MDDKTQQKINRIKELLKQQEAIQKELASLVSPEKIVALPPDFSINSEILAIISGAGNNGVTTSTIFRILQQKYPDYGIDRKKIASSLAYLKNTKKQIDLIGRGVYKMINLSESV